MRIVFEVFHPRRPPNLPKPQSADPVPFSSTARALCVPFFVFILFIGLASLVQRLGRPEFLLAHPQYWVYPLQTVVCGALLVYWRRCYSLQWPRKGAPWAFTLAIAVLVLVLWISPQEFFGVARRMDGFDPTAFPSGTPLYWGTLIFRFLRLAVVVPFLEEFFWRGFLLRYLISEDFEKVPVGAFSWLSFSAVTLCFALEHQWADFWPALITGALYNFVAIRTRSLGLCVLAHAVTNLLLGVYIMKTGQWGFW